MFEQLEEVEAPLTPADLAGLIARLAVDTAEMAPAEGTDAKGTDPGVDIRAIAAGPGGHDAAFAAFVAARDAARAGSAAQAGGSSTQAARIDRVRALESLKAAVAAAQIREVAVFAVEQQAAQRAAGVHPDDLDRGVGAQVALATRASHYAGRRFTRYARLLVDDLPHTLTALAEGRTTERRAMLVAQHTAWLDPEQRATVDAQLADRLESLGDRGVEAQVQKLAYETDPRGYTERIARAHEDRRVSVRPAPDTMAYVTGLLPATAAVACKAALKSAADALKAAGDARSHSQIEADLFVAAITGRQPLDGVPVRPDLADLEDLADLNLEDLDRVDLDPDDRVPAADFETAGQPSAAPTRAAPSAPSPTESAAESAAERTPEGLAPRFGGLPAGANVEIKLVMTDLALFGAGNESAHLEGYGPVPASWIRELLATSGPEVGVHLRRLFTDAETGALAAIDSTRREFTGLLRELLLARDQHCRQPWCEAPIRHLDHITPHADGGPTTLRNGQGLCAACNYAKQAPGWTTIPSDDPADPDVVRITTPTGHRYTSRPPDPPGRADRDTHFSVGATHPSAPRWAARAHVPDIIERSHVTGRPFTIELALTG